MLFIFAARASLRLKTARPPAHTNAAAPLGVFEMKLVLFYLVAAAAAVFGLSSYSASVERSTFEKVKSGELVLRCDFRDGTRDVDPELVTGTFEGRWEFTNGSASSCRLIVVKGEVL